MDSFLSEHPSVTFMRSKFNSYCSFDSRVLRVDLLPEVDVRIPEDAMVTGISLFCPSNTMDIQSLERLVVTLVKDDHVIVIGEYSGRFLFQTNILHCKSLRARPLILERDISVHDTRSMVREIQLQKYIELPMLSYVVYGTGLLRSGYTLHVSTTWANACPDIQLCFSMIATTDPAEQSRFQGIQFDAVHHTCVTTTSMVSLGHNNIKIFTSPNHPDVVSGGLVFVQFPENKVPLNFNAKLHTHGDRIVDVDELTGRCIHGIPLLEGCFVVDFGLNLALFRSETQPAGHTTLTHESRLEFTSDMDTSVTITVIYFSSVNYREQSITTFYTEERERQEQARLLEERMERERLEREQLQQEMPERNAEHYIRDPNDYVRHVPEPAPVIEPDMAQVVYSSRDLSQIVMTYLVDNAPYIRTWEECCVLQEPIPEGGYYVRCLQCKKIMSKPAMQGWFSRGSHNCPHCRHTMGICQLFRNRFRWWYLFDYFFTEQRI